MDGDGGWVSDMNQGNKDFGFKKVGSRFSCVATGTKRLSLALPRAAKKNFFSSSFGSPEAPLFFYIHVYNFLSNLAHLNHKPAIAMVYSLRGCVQIFIIFIFGGVGGGFCQIGHYLQYIYFLIFALDIIVCFILYFAFTSTSFFMFTLFLVSSPLFRGNTFG